MYGKTVQARLFHPGLGRFVQPDTIIRNPFYPQSFNRYSYVNNSPIVFNDPTGHVSQPGDLCEIEGQCDSGNSVPSLAIYEGNWTAAEKNAFNAEIDNIAASYEQALKSKFSSKGLDHEFDYWGITPDEIFLEVHGGPITFVRSSVSAGYWGEITGTNEVTFYSNVSASTLIENSKIIVHEIGHLFNTRIGGQGASSLPVYTIRTDHPAPNDEDARIIDHLQPNGEFWGFAGGYRDWQFAYFQTTPANEDFADTFVGWAFGGVFDYRHSSGWGYLRRDIMSNNMGDWVMYAMNIP